MTEDRNFYHEHGFSVKGLARAAYLLVKNKVLGRDYISMRGSSFDPATGQERLLTQQQTFSRKAEEILSDRRKSGNQYSKNVLTMYLNNAYFGHGFGRQDAAKRF